MKFAPLRGIAPVRLRPPDAMPRNGNRSEGSVGNPSVGTRNAVQTNRATPVLLDRH
jgi:hypothetical protein